MYYIYNQLLHMSDYRFDRTVFKMQPCRPLHKTRRGMGCLGSKITNRDLRAEGGKY
jgi:hypothetical protein